MQELPGLKRHSMIDVTYYNSNLDKLGFQLREQGRQELPGLKLQSMIVILDKL